MRFFLSVSLITAITLSAYAQDSAAAQTAEIKKAVTKAIINSVEYRLCQESQAIGLLFITFSAEGEFENILASASPHCIFKGKREDCTIFICRVKKAGLKQKAI